MHKNDCVCTNKVLSVQAGYGAKSYKSSGPWSGHMSSVFVSGLLIVVYNKKFFCHGSLTNMYIDKVCEPLFLRMMIHSWTLWWHSFSFPLEGGSHGIKFY